MEGREVEKEGKEEEDTMKALSIALEEERASLHAAHLAASEVEKYLVNVRHGIQSSLLNEKVGVSGCCLGVRYPQTPVVVSGVKGYRLVSRCKDWDSHQMGVIDHAI